MLVIAIKRPDGGVSINYPVSFDRARPHLTSEELFNDSLSRVSNQGEVSIIDSSLIPTDRTFRNAWIHSIEGIRECPIKSRDILRVKRNKKLEELDVIAVRESRKPNGRISEIDSKAEMLRGIPQRENFDSLSIEELKLIVSEIEGVK